MGTLILRADASTQIGTGHVMRSLALDGPLPAAEVRLRFAQPDDLMPLLRLSNEPTVRESSLCSDRITLEEHSGWFTERLLSPYVRMGGGLPLLGNAPGPRPGVSHLGVFVSVSGHTSPKR